MRSEREKVDKKQRLRLVMAGGGTGGHLFPIIALAQQFEEHCRDVDIIFIGGRHGIEEKVVPEYGYRLKLLDVEAIKRRKGLKRIKALLKVFGATLRAVSILRSIRPHGVIGSGSYSSAPVVMAARLMGIKTAILEQNAVPGLTNRILGKFVDRIYIAFEQAGAYFPRQRTLVTGNPVRREILENKKILRNGKFSLLVFGGSQGATAINAAFLDAIEYLTDIWSGMRVVHQTGSEGFEAAEAAYRRKGLRVEVHRFIDDMAGAYARADLVVCRAGATSIAEITALGLPSVLVPYPFAADDHQEVNARCLAERGAAVVIKQDNLTGSVLAEAIREFYTRPVKLRTVKEAVQDFARPRAAATIVEDYLKLIGRGD